MTEFVCEETRLKTDWYRKRIEDNRAIKKFLLARIEERISYTYIVKSGFTRYDLEYLNYEDLLELAIAVWTPDVDITLGAGKDFSNGSDAKVSIVRTHNYGKSYGANIRTAGKRFIQSVVYEPLQEKFYFFSFPVELKEYDIPFEADGTPKRTNRHWQWERRDFEAMCQLGPSGNHCASQQFARVAMDKFFEG